MTIEFRIPLLVLAAIISLGFSATFQVSADGDLSEIEEVLLESELIGKLVSIKIQSMR